MAKINIFLAYIFERSDKMYRHLLFIKKINDSGKNQLIFSIYI